MALALRFKYRQVRMKTKLIYPMVLVLFAAACGGHSNARGTAAQQQYETVQEGSAAGVTSTISGPGETLPPMTATNVDTTTAFALNPNAVPAGTPQQAAVSAPPAAQPYTGAGTPMTASPSSAPRPMTPGIAAIAMKQTPQPKPATAQPAEPAAKAEPAPAAEATTGPAAETDTAATAEIPKKDEAPQPPAEDTTGQQAEEPPPPPPPM
jgi:hypothetical protein